jgi:hypothetical protein
MPHPRPPRAPVARSPIPKPPHAPHLTGSVTFGWSETRRAAVPKIVPCEACGGMRYLSRSPHAPRWHDGLMVDCVGEEVPLHYRVTPKVQT